MSQNGSFFTLLQCLQMLTNCCNSCIYYSEIICNSSVIDLRGSPADCYNTALRKEFQLDSARHAMRTRRVRLTSCINEVGSSIFCNRLKLNSEKTQFTCLGTRYQLAKVDATVFVVNGSAVKLLHAVTCLGVIVDQQLSFADHVRCLVNRGFYWLKQLRSIRRTLTRETTKTLVYATIISRMDYCNGVLAVSTKSICASCRASSMPQRD